MSDRARIQFSNLLQDVVYKQNSTNFEQLSPDKSLNENDRGHVNYQFIDIEGRGLSKLSEYEKKLESGSCVVKLFERFVDLDKFNAKSSLYSICRDWVNDSEPLHSSNKVELKEAVYILPKPNQQVKLQKVPLNLKRKTKISGGKISKERVENALMNSESIDFDIVKGEWVQTRMKWQSNNRENEKRYTHTYNYLRSMFLTS
ncbi:protein lin-37 homolog [Symsagittifera roscoffensis]|uniref:protein lin-37 homolog n=1 Tax=Symsagittifera roscoffensis TaxID=84072 RepID=UPI00307CB088